MASNCLEWSRVLDRENNTNLKEGLTKPLTADHDTHRRLSQFQRVIRNVNSFGMSEASLKVENFADFSVIASERIVHALCHSRNSCLETWALEYLHRAGRGFENGQDGWNEFPETLERVKDILSFNSLQFKTHTVDPELLSLALKGIFKCHKRNNTLIDKLFSQNMPARNACLDIMSGPGDILYDRNMLHSIEIKSFFRYLWTFVGKTNLCPNIISELLLLVPECVEHTIINLALKDCKSLGEIKLSSETDDVQDGDEEDARPLDDLIYVQYFNLLKAAAVSPRLFQMCTSIINQLLVSCAGCACCLSPFVSLAATFVTETSKGRAWFYPNEIKPIALLMEAEYKIGGLESYINDIQKQIVLINETQPPEVLVAIFSNFPNWLPILDPSLIVRL